MTHESLSRRSVLASGATALGVSLAGCSGGGGGGGGGGGPTVGILEDRSG
ncbi:urea ABC transporter substrate-binding protein, partial [Halorubrum sp. SD626R]